MALAGTYLWVSYKRQQSEENLETEEDDDGDRDVGYDADASSSSGDESVLWSDSESSNNKHSSSNGMETEDKDTEDDTDGQRMLAAGPSFGNCGLIWQPSVSDVSLSSEGAYEETPSDDWCPGPVYDYTVPDLDEEPVVETRIRSWMEMETAEYTPLPDVHVCSAACRYIHESSDTHHCPSSDDHEQPGSSAHAEDTTPCASSNYQSSTVENSN